MGATLVLGACAAPGPAPSSRPPAHAVFTSGAGPAWRFGVHEVYLLDFVAMPEPFSVEATVTFTPPSGAANAKTVNVFYDGGGTWRARVYPDEVGSWRWRSDSARTPQLAGRTGSFDVRPSALRGRLLPHPSSPRHWRTEDGRWFLNLDDTAYFLLLGEDGEHHPIPDEDARAYVEDIAALGITSVRVQLGTIPSGKMSDLIDDAGRPALPRFRLSDARLRWMLDTHPDIYVQLIVLPLEDGWRVDQHSWTARPTAIRERLLREVVARFAAYPQIFWLVTNDAHYGPGFPFNDQQAREVGTYLARHDPWHHPRSTGAARQVAFPFAGETWATYIHLENEHDLGAALMARYWDANKPVFLGEDRYENDHGPGIDPAHMRVWQRRLFWSWLLSGGSTNYAGRWWVVHPYRQTGRRTARSSFRGRPATFNQQLVGLDSVLPIRRFFDEQQIDLATFVPDHALARDEAGRSGADAPRVARRGWDELLVYHPQSRGARATADVDPGAPARFSLDLSRAAGALEVEWYRCADGATRRGGTVNGGARRRFEAPWIGQDVVLRLLRRQGS